MAWLRRLLTADPSLLAGGSALSGPVGLLAVEEEEEEEEEEDEEEEEEERRDGACHGLEAGR
jgi:hypothetical protein